MSSDLERRVMQEQNMASVVKRENLARIIELLEQKHLYQSVSLKTTTINELISQTKGKPQQQLRIRLEAIFRLPWRFGTETVPKPVDADFPEKQYLALLLPTFPH